MIANDQQFVHLRVPKFMYELLARESFISGLSRQEVIRQMIKRCLNEKYQCDILLRSDKVREQIEKEQHI